VELVSAEAARKFMSQYQQLHPHAGESNDARNTREFFEHRKLVLDRISRAIQQEREQKKRKR
jgi:hypothetical protein